MLLRLYEIAERNNIIIDYAPLKKPILAFYWHRPPIPAHIVLSDKLHENTTEFICVLAEEIGHHFTAPNSSSLNILRYREKLQVGWTEKKALIYAAELLIPDELYYEARKWCRNDFELCDYLNVTKDVLEAKNRTLTQKLHYARLQNRLSQQSWQPNTSGRILVGVAR